MSATIEHRAAVSRQARTHRRMRIEAEARSRGWKLVGWRGDKIVVRVAAGGSDNDHSRS